MTHYYPWLLLALFSAACTTSVEQQSTTATPQTCDTVFVRDFPSIERTALEALPASITLPYDSKTTHRLAPLDLERLYNFLKAFKTAEVIDALPDSYVQEHFIVYFQTTGFSEPYLHTCRKRFDHLKTSTDRMLGKVDGTIPLYKSIYHIEWGSDTSNSVEVSIRYLL